MIETDDFAQLTRLDGDLIICAKNSIKKFEEKTKAKVVWVHYGPLTDTNVIVALYRMGYDLEQDEMFFANEIWFGGDENV